MDIVFASANRNKIIEAQGILGPNFNVILPSDLGFNGDIPEDHETIEENSEQKARFIWDLFHKPCFSDDTGLEVDALGGEPGVYSARYAGEPKNMERNIEKLLSKLEGVPEEKRTARFRCVVSYVNEEGILTAFEGKCEGRINFAPVMQNAFGYDPVFIPEGKDCTMAEMSREEKNALSHRGMAMRALECHLSKNQGR